MEPVLTDTKGAAYALYINEAGEVIGFEDMSTVPIRTITPIATDAGTCGESVPYAAGGVLVPLRAIACPPGYVIRCIGGICRCVRA